MINVFKALLPAIIAQICWFMVDRQKSIQQVVWFAIIAILLVIGGIISASFLIKYIKQNNIDRGSGTTVFVGGIIMILYFVVFFFSGLLFSILFGH